MAKIIEIIPAAAGIIFRFQLPLIWAAIAISKIPEIKAKAAMKRTIAVSAIFGLKNRMEPIDIISRPKNIINQRAGPLLVMRNAPITVEIPLIKKTAPINNRMTLTVSVGLIASVSPNSNSRPPRNR